MQGRQAGRVSDAGSETKQPRPFGGRQTVRNSPSHGECKTHREGRIGITIMEKGDRFSSTSRRAQFVKTRQHFCTVNGGSDS